jgi:Domain of unknown function (DUF6265)
MTHTNAQISRPEVPTQLKSLEWLIGTWERTNVKAGMRSTEKWHVDTPSALTGWGVTLRGKDTAFLEKMRIIEKGNHIYYIADVKENPEPVYFKFVSITAGGFICENPDHDFPKRIEYSLNDSNLMVTISAGNKSQQYLFVRK